MQRGLINRCAAATAVAATLAIFGLPANAADEISEIIVTARKVQERLVDVPVSITALTAEDIEEKGIRSLDDVAANTPGLTFSNLQGEILPAPVIRGVAPIDIFGENNVAIFIDGVYVSGRSGLNFSQLDLERVEVMKGPQAALYGRNAFSGAINYVTAKPTDVFEGKTTVTVGNDGKFLTAVSASGPLIEGTLKGRVAAGYDKFDGSYENQYVGLGRGADIGGHEYKSGQGSLLWTPNDDFEAELSLYVSRDQIDTSAQRAVAMNCEDRHDAVPALSSRLLNFCGRLPSVDDDDISAIPQALGEERKLNRAHLRLNWDTEVGTFTSLTGYSALKHNFLIDGSRGGGENVIFTYLSDLVTAGPPFNHYSQKKTFTTGLLQIDPPSTINEVSQELRFTSPEDRAFRYSGAIYLFDTKQKATNDATGFVMATQPLPNDFGSFCLACTYTGPVGQWIDFAQGAADASLLPWFTQPLGGGTYDKVSINEEKAYAALAYAEWDFLEGWTGRIEGRYTKTDKDIENKLTSTRGDDTWHTTDWRATVDYKPAEDMTVYGSVAHAEKAGGFDVQTVTFQDDPGNNVTLVKTFDPEKNTTYEMGFKSELLDRRLRSALAVYYIDWTKIVIPQGVDSIDGRLLDRPRSFSVNSGDADIKGAELSVDAIFTDFFKGNFGLSYVDAEYGHAPLDSAVQFPSYAPDGNVKGNTITRTSEWQANIGASYQAPLRGDVDWYLRTDAAYRGKQYADPTNEAIIPASTTVNAHLGLTKDTWSVEVYALNLLGNDEALAAYRDVFFTNTTPDGVNNGGTFFPWRYSITYPKLQQYGVTWRMKF